MAYSPGDLMQRLARRTPVEVLMQRLPGVEIHLVAQAKAGPVDKRSAP